MSSEVMRQTERGATPFERWFASGYDWFFARIDARGAPTFGNG
jgi:hypothetical protein